MCYASSPSYADTAWEGVTYAGDIYTYVGSNSANFHDGGIVKTNEDGTYGDLNTTWSNNIQTLFCSGSNYNTLRFVAPGTELKSGITVTTSNLDTNCSFAPLLVGGLIVEEGAAGYTWRPNNNGAREVRIGNASDATFTVNEDFNFGGENNKWGVTKINCDWYVNVAAGKTLHFYTNSFSGNNGAINLVGSGTLDLHGATLGSGSGLNMYGTGTLSNAVVNGATLYYNAADGTLFTASEVSWTSGVISIAESITDTFVVCSTFDLGVDLSGGDFTLDGWDAAQYSISGSTLTILQTEIAMVDVTWDSAWGLTEAVPTQAKDAQVTTTSISLAEQVGSYQEGIGIVNVVTGTGDLTGVNLAGGYYDESTTGTATAVNSSIWTKVTGGDFAMILGGNYAQNWNGTDQWNVVGDIHTQVEGSTKVDWLMGGNYKDATDA